MKRLETLQTPAANKNTSSRAHTYQKVCDNRKQPIRGLWRRNGNYLARLSVEDDMGRKQVKWTPLGMTERFRTQFNTDGGVPAIVALGKFLRMIGRSQTTG